MRIEERDAARAGRQRQERYEAYSQLLSASMMVVHTVSIMRLTMQIRAGLGEGINVALRVRKPLDPFEVGTHLGDAFEPLFRAASHIGVIGSKEAIRKSNRLLDAAMDVLGTGTTRGQATEGLARSLLGEKWTPAQMEEFLGKTRALGEARRQFALVAQQELGSEVADLFLRDDTSRPAETGGDTMAASGSVKQAPR